MAKQQEQRPWTRTVPVKKRGGAYAFYVTSLRTGTVRIHRSDDPSWTPPAGSVAAIDQRAASTRARRWVPGLARYDDQRRREAARRLRAQTSAIRRARRITTGEEKVDPITRWWVTRQADRQLAAIQRRLERAARPSLAQRVRRGAGRQVRVLALATQRAVTARVQSAREAREAQRQERAAAARAAALADALAQNRRRADAQLARDLAEWDTRDRWGRPPVATPYVTAPAPAAEPDYEPGRRVLVVHVGAHQRDGHRVGAYTRRAR